MSQEKMKFLTRQRFILTLKKLSKDVIIQGSLVLALFMGLMGCSEKDKPKIGVIQTSDHEALNATRFGLMDELRSQGLIAGQDIHFKWESAQGNPATASQIAQKFLGNNYDILVSIGTMASQATLQAAKGTSVPVIYASVTDPKGAKLEGNISGVSNFVEPKIQLSAFKKILPDLKKIGVIYSSGEQNSVALIDFVKAAAKELDIEVVFATATKTSDVYTAAMSLVGKVDALFVNNDNIALAAFDSVLKVSREQKIPAFVSDTDLVQKGAVAAIGPSQHRIGLKAGKMVVTLLSQPKEKRNAGNIPSEGHENPLMFINEKAAQSLGIRISDTILREAASVY
ncbi:MAG: ABC transporter substrate-binding protein [Chitinophagaceae bacterium]